MNKVLFLVLFAVSFSVLLGYNQDAYAVDGTISGSSSCTAIGGTWSAGFCTVTSLTINSGENLIVGVAPYPGVILYNTGTITINSGGTLTNSPGTLTGLPGTIVNLGTINNKAGGTITNNGASITNNGNINNDGTINNNDGGFFLSYGGGTINNNAGGTINNNAGSSISNGPGGTINNDGAIINNGGINNDCGSSYNGNLPTINLASSCPDNDFDGIINELDTMPNTASDDFADNDPAPITSGTITSRGDQSIKIEELADPEGVRILAETEGGPTPATIVACSGATTGSLTAEDEIIVTCASVDIQVVIGPVDITFTDGTTTGSSTLDTGDSIVFDPTSFSITNNGNNPVVIIINDERITIPPGQTFSGGPPSNPVGGTIIPIDTTALLLANTQSFSWMIPAVLSILGIGLFVVSRKSENS